uniref:Putative encoded protein n=1 Tax=Dunaliella salina TaxID=3046 RepID=A0A1C8XRJ0_DUNSA|nr:putative encoded protein [Dunaliella salina]|eukprot:scaffold329740_cov916-Tisochrysis_lutea.AAC.2
MARRRPPISSPFSSSLVSRRTGPSVPWPSICESPIASLSVYRDLPSYKDICILALVLMVCLVMLCALRENTSESNAEFDSRPFVRFIKRKFFGTSDALVVAAALAVVSALGLIDISSPVKI